MNSKSIGIENSNGSILKGRLYQSQTLLRGAVMIAPATGIKVRFYQAFAEYLAENGYGVICFDNEGIGESLSGSIKSSNASLISWGQNDMSAVLVRLLHGFPDTSYHLIGHSAGGQLFGLMDNAHKLSSVFNFACSSGSMRNIEKPFRYKGKFFLNVFIPLSNFIFGYVKAQWLGMGDPLPKKVAQQWSEYCNGQGYIKVALDKGLEPHWYHELKMPALWLNASDDPIANDVNVADMIAVFTKLQSITKTIQAHQDGLGEIGHMGFFQKKYKVLWPLALDWLEEQSGR